jgi:hypothetical protein
MAPSSNNMAVHRACMALLITDLLFVFSPNITHYFHGAESFFRREQCHTSQEISLIFGTRIPKLFSHKPAYFVHPEPDESSPIPSNEAL